MQIALIVSSGRTGTQFLAHYFQGNFEDVVAVHEPKPRATVRIASNAWAAAAVPRGLPLAVLRRKARRLESLRCRLYVESNPFLWGAVDLFDEVFGEPAVVHVVRDPRTQVRSSLNHGTSTGLKGLANRWVPFWYPEVRAVPGVGDKAHWLDRAAGLWTLVNERLREAGTRCSNYHLLRYEDLFDESYSGLDQLCEILGLDALGAGAPVDPAVPRNVGVREVLPSWESWSDEECRTLDRICGPLMSAYGYGGEQAWRARVAPGAGAEDS